jgi:catechol 2,3-dioxygenase-like lactoylglutathione lyase family enzyme
MDHGIKVSTVNISCPDPPALARFYAALLGMEVRTEEPGWVIISGPDSIPLSFELDRHYQRRCGRASPGSRRPSCTWRCRSAT